MNIKSSVSLWTVTTLIAGSLLLAGGQKADAKSEFRQFRDHNPGIDRHQARSLFHTQMKGIPSSAASQGGLRGHSSIQTNFISGPVNAGARLDGITRRLEHQIKRGRSVEVTANNSLVKLSSGLNLDLSSTEKTIVLGDNLLNNSGPVQVTIGGEVKTFERGSRVTPAEYIAVKQALSGVGQTLVVAGDGSASGGTLNLDGLNSDNSNLRASALVIPQGVTTSGDFTKGSDFKLTGDLSNFGTVLIASARDGKGSIQADDIYNASGASISASGDLNLGAAKSLINEGTINAGGTLTITAGQSLKNSSTISAGNDLTISAPEVRNSGSITSTNGNVAFGAPGFDLNIDNNGGTISAAQGAINIREASFQDSFNTTVAGGDLQSASLNLNAGGGSMDVAVNQLTGVVTETGSEAHLSASTADLVLGKICLTGDPTYKNNAGNITILSDINVGEALTIVASGNVIIANNNVDLIAANATGGFPITILAGAAQVAGGINSTTAPGGGIPSAVTVTGQASATGGSVQFTGTNLTINTRSTGKKGSGGDVFIGAWEGGNALSGQIDLTGVSIFTGGQTKKDANGSVVISTGASASALGIINNIDTTGGALDSGSVIIRTANPTSSNGQNVVFNSAGQITSGNSIITGGGVGGQAADLSFIGTVKANVQIRIDSADGVGLFNNASLISSGSVRIDALGNISNATTTLIQAGLEVDLDSAKDIGTLANRINVISALPIKLDANTGNIFVISPENLTVATPVVGSNTGTIRLNGAKDIIVTSSITGGDVTLFSTFGDVTITETGSLNGTQTSVNAFAQSGNLTVLGNISASPGFVGLSNDLGNLTFGPGALVTADNGIFISNGASKGGNKIIFNNGSSLGTLGKVNGEISIIRGPLQANVVLAPKNTTVQETGAQVNFFGAQAKGKTPNNSIEAQGADVTVSTTKKNKIVFGGAVDILADPPVPEGTPTITTYGATSPTRQSLNSSNPGLAMQQSSAALQRIPVKDSLNGSILEVNNVDRLSSLLTFSQTHLKRRRVALLTDD